MNTKYTIIDKISAIRVRCSKILPAVYDESLSYMEAIAKLAYKVNETITAVNGLNDNVDTLNDAVINFNERLTGVENEIDNFEQEINDKFNDLETDINNSVNAKLDEIDGKFKTIEDEQKRFESEINAKVNVLENTLMTIINDELAYLNAMYSRLADELRNYIVEKVNEAISEIPDLTNIFVVDPTTGKLSKVQEAILNIFYFGLNESLTIDEFNRLNLTVNELNELMVDNIPRGLTIYEWLKSAKTLLVKQLDIARIEFLAYPHSVVLDYLNGSKVWHDRNADINQMLIQVSGGYSCGELNTMNLTYSDIADAEISCFNYVMKANMLLV